MIGREQLGDRADRDHLLVGHHRHPVADLVQRIEIVGDQEHGQPQRLLQLDGQLVERRRADRVEPGGRLVEEQQFGIERQRPRQAGALPHAARQLGRILAGRVLGQAGQHHLVARDLVRSSGPSSG